MVEFVERSVNVNGVELTLLEAGEGPPLLILHEELGHPGALAWHAELAKTRRLVVPVHPGFRGERVKWIRGVRDLALLYGFLVRQAGLKGCDAIGFSLGGWIAAEIAVGDPGLFRTLTLVAPFGVKPKDGFIMDMFPITALDYLRATVHDPDGLAEFAQLYGEDCPEKVESWEDARTESARLGWQPYMHNPSLPDLLGGLVGLPTLVVWGDQDQILPGDAARTYAERTPGARLKIIPGVGHRPEVEARSAFVAELQSFLN